MVRLDIEVFGDKQTSRELLRFSERPGFMRPVFWTIADEFRSIEKRQFDSQGASSRGWRPLKPATVRAKARAGLDPRILHATLRLRRSLTQRGRDHIRRFSKDEMFVGSKVPYGVHHQFGAPAANLPRRRPVDLSESDRKDFVRRMQLWILKGELDF
ncbi:MAG: phage virion morphogenesis protein [Intrasporangiaceae bacterium]|nr:phage virion morphogenesis protein [Intrasporangiaceae bacterium]